MDNDERAKILIEGPPKGAKHCEGCPLFETMAENGNHCPYFGDVYTEPSGEDQGLHCRPDECLSDEVKQEHPERPAIPEGVRELLVDLLDCPTVWSGVHEEKELDVARGWLAKCPQASAKAEPDYFGNLKETAAENYAIQLLSDLFEAVEAYPVKAMSTRVELILEDARAFLLKVRPPREPKVTP